MGITYWGRKTICRTYNVQEIRILPLVTNITGIYQHPTHTRRLSYGNRLYLPENNVSFSVDISNLPYAGYGHRTLQLWELEYHNQHAYDIVPCDESTVYQEDYLYPWEFVKLYQHPPNICHLTYTLPTCIQYEWIKSMF